MCYYLNKVMVQLVLFLFVSFVTLISGDRPCKSRPIPGQSVVCVCNTTYCDELDREIPATGKYITYTSSEAGSRFTKAIFNIQLEIPLFLPLDTSATTLVIDPTQKYQLVEGFGGAVTDSASINWMNLTDYRLKKKFIDSYFSRSGLRYNMLRVPIGGSDFSTHPYAYNEIPSGDVTLSNFSLAYEDYEYKIPMIKEIIKTAVEPVHVLGTTWSPPIWMKNNQQYGGWTELKEEYYQTYADYHVKFINNYAANGIPIWGITTTNEPLNGMIGAPDLNNLGWSPLKQGKWIAENLGPTIRNSSFPNVKILALDDQRASLPLWFNTMLAITPGALKYIDGVAVHFYTDQFISPGVLSLVNDKYPDKFLLSTEACAGANIGDPSVVLGSWDRAVLYITDILEDLNHNFVGWIDWNMCLDSQGGPNWVDNFVDSPVIVFPENNEFVKQPMYYALGHFSKFLPRGSQRINVTQKSSSKSILVQNVAFLTPQKTVVVVLYNGSGASTSVSLQLGWKKATVQMEAKSVVTVEIAYN